MSRTLKGSVGSPGIGFGTTYHRAARENHGRSASLSGPAALQAFADARDRLAGQLQQLGDELRAEGKEAEAGIFDAHALLATDPTLEGEIERLLISEGRPLDVAIRQATAIVAATLTALEDAYLRERAADVRAVGQQLLALLDEQDASEEVPRNAIIVADDLTPTQTALLRNAGIAGIATAAGTATGHVAILARALGLPAVVGLGPDLLTVPPDTPAIIAAHEGLLIVEPDAGQQAAYQAQAAELLRLDERRRASAGEPVTLTDGPTISLWANIGHPDEAPRAVQYGAQGVGLFRTEFLFLDRPQPPSEDEQYAAYVSALQALGGRPLIVRTLDVGGDKPIPYLAQLAESNPFLGVRGIRFSMRFPDLFGTQLRALLRAAAVGDLRIMLPMVSTVEDVIWARGELESAAQALQAAGVACRADVPLGIMVETPAAAVTLDLLASHIHFCSIGSNDLSQYVLAADRTSPELTKRYSDSSVAVLRLIGAIAREAQRLGLELSFCGQLAGDPASSVLLVGLGLTKLSMDAGSISAVAERLRGTSLREARRLAARACRKPQQRRS